MHRVRVGRSHRITLPSDVCRQLGIDTGDLLWVDVRGDQVVLRKEPGSWAARSFGLHKEVWAGIDPVAYVRAERATWAE
jgi:AbrB family looped-hinge helix DNA binding protein